MECALKTRQLRSPARTLTPEPGAAPLGTQELGSTPISPRTQESGVPIFRDPEVGGSHGTDSSPSYRTRASARLSPATLVPARSSGPWSTCLNSCKWTARRWKACRGAPGFWAKKASSLKATGWPWKKHSSPELPAALLDPSCRPPSLACGKHRWSACCEPDPVQGLMEALGFEALTPEKWQRWRAVGRGRGPDTGAHR